MLKYRREKKIISILLSAALVFSFNMPAFAEEIEDDSLAEGIVLDDESETSGNEVIDVEAELADPEDERNEICYVYRHNSENMNVLTGYVRGLGYETSFSDEYYFSDNNRNAGSFVRGKDSKGNKDVFVSQDFKFYVKSDELDENEDDEDDEEEYRELSQNDIERMMYKEDDGDEITKNVYVSFNVVISGMYEVPSDDGRKRNKRITYRIHNEEPDEIEIALKPDTITIKLLFCAGESDSLILPQGTSYFDVLNLLKKDNKLGMSLKCSHTDESYLNEEIVRLFSISGDSLYIECRPGEFEQRNIKLDNDNSEVVVGTPNKLRVKIDDSLSSNRISIITDDSTRFNVSTLDLDQAEYVFRVSPSLISVNGTAEFGNYTIKYPLYLPYMGEDYKNILKKTNNLIYILSENGVPISGEPPVIKSIGIKKVYYHRKKIKVLDSINIKWICFQGGKKIKPDRGKIKIEINPYHIDETNAAMVIELGKKPKAGKYTPHPVKGLKVNFSDITVNGNPVKVLKKALAIKPNYVFYNRKRDTIEFYPPFSGSVSTNVIQGLDLYT